MSKSVLPMFSSKSFMISRLIFRSLIHFEFLFSYSVRKCYNFIVLHVAVQFSIGQHHLLKRLSSPLYFLASFIIDQLTIGAWVYLWTFYSVSLIYISVFVLVPYVLIIIAFQFNLKLRSLIPSVSSFSILLCLLGILCVPKQS